MSGFLQRVIATAQSPGGSIHPLLGSVLSPTPRPDRSPDAPAAAASPEYRAATAARSGIDSADRGRADGAGASRGVAVEFHADVPPADFDSTAPGLSRRGTVAPERRATEDFVSAPLSNPAIAVAHDPTNAVRTSDDAASRATAMPASAMRSSISDREDSAAQTADTRATARYSPLMPDNVRSTAPADGFAPLSPRWSAPPAGEARDDPRQSRQPAREADDIHIHIGRIEVTAAAPAPARAAAAQPRKSPSLDEFLKRRPGRAG
jgi:hypothetical protein